MSSRTSSSQTRRRHSANPSMEGYPAAQPRCQVVLEGLSRFLPFKGKRRTYQRIAGDGEFSALSGQQLRHQPPWCMERIRPARAAWAVLAQVPARSAEGNAQHGRLNRKVAPAQPATLIKYRLQKRSSTFRNGVSKFYNPPREWMT